MKFVMFLFITYSDNHNEILHTSRQLYFRDVCKISLWSYENILNQSTSNFDRIWSISGTGSRSEIDLC